MGGIAYLKSLRCHHVIQLHEHVIQLHHTLNNAQHVISKCLVLKFQRKYYSEFGN